MSDRNVAGLALGIERAGHLVTMRTYGYADRTSKRRVDAQTIFPIGSLTKSFTAALLRTLVRDGRLASNARLGRYVPEYPAAGAVTIDALLAQTGGIQDYAQTPGFSPASSLPVAPVELIALVAPRPLQPSGTFLYANTNYLLAALVAARVAGVPYEMLLQRDVLQPLHLTRTAVANAFVPTGDRARGNAPYDDGFFRSSTFSRPIAYASGYVPGFSSYWLTGPDRSLTVIVLANTGNVDLGPLARSVVAAILDIREDM